MKSTSALNPSTQLNMGFLKELGVPAEEVTKLRDDLHRANQLAVDHYGFVSWARLSDSARRCQVKLPVDTLQRLFATQIKDTIAVNRIEADFPKAEVSRSGSDGVIGIDSHRRLLAEGGGAQIFQKSVLEHLFLRRQMGEGPQATFELNGFANQKIEVQVPPGGTLMIVDADGNQRAYGVKPAELTSSMMGEQPFTIKVLDKARSVILEKTFQMNEDLAARRSQVLLTGTFAKRPANDPHPELPHFAVGDEAKCERVLVKRDGNTYPILRFEQLLSPPGAKPQFFTVGRLTFTVQYASGENAIDGDKYDWKQAAKILASDRRGITFDPTLKETRQAKWTVRGLEIYEPHQEKPFAVFDPFFSKAPPVPG